MARRCTTCTQVDRFEIDQHLIAGTRTHQQLANQYGMSKAAIARHKREHLKDSALAKAISTGTSLTTTRDEITRKAMEYLYRLEAIADRAEQSANLKAETDAIKAGTSQLRLVAELLGELQNQVVVSVVKNPEWIELRQIIFEALRPYPEARVAVAEALMDPEKDIIDAEVVEV